MVRTRVELVSYCFRDYAQGYHGKCALNTRERERAKVNEDYISVYKYVHLGGRVCIPL